MKTIFFNIIVIIINFEPMFSQSPLINIFPDSVNILMHNPNEIVIDSFGITNIGFDTLSYEITYNQIVDTSLYKHEFSNINLIESDSTIRATIFYPSADFILLRIKFPLLIEIPTHVEFFLFESATKTGSYHKTYSKLHFIDSSKIDNYIESEDLNIILHSGTYYSIGVAWENSVQYNYGSAGLSSDGLQIHEQGNFIQYMKYPTDSILIIPEVHYSSSYEMELIGGIALWLELLSDSSGSIAAGDTNTIKFSVRDPGFIGPPPLTNYFIIHSNDLLDSIKYFAASRSFLVDAEMDKNNSFLEYSLEQNYPNPFNPITIIKYNLSKPSYVKLVVYDILGNEIINLVNNEQAQGNHEIIFDGKGLSSGIYF